MTILFDTTANHVGDSHDTSQGGGWVDYGMPMLVGATAESFYAEVISGGPLDFAAGLVEGSPASSTHYWFNVNTSGPLTGSVGAPYIITPNTHLLVYTRNLTSAFVCRVVVSDQPTTSAPSGSFCQFGTRLQNSVGGNIILTAGLISAVLQGAFGATGSVLSTLMDMFVGRVLYTDALCAGPPPTMPEFTRDDWLFGQPGIPAPGSIDKFWQGMLASAWPFFCECVPNPTGGTAPVLYPTPTLTVPKSIVVTPPTFECDGGDLCAVLNEILATVNSMMGQVTQLRADVTLIQRQKVPFAYVPGTLHSGLTGAGQFTVQGILGLAVQVTTVPGASGEVAGDPIARFGLGWITTGTVDGWRKSVPIRHNPMWVDVEPDDTLIGYALEPLVVANIEEFSREP